MTVVVINMPYVMEEGNIDKATSFHFHISGERSMQSQTFTIILYCTDCWMLIGLDIILGGLAVTI